jgi:excisionase family DNA binding protein
MSPAPPSAEVTSEPLTLPVPDAVLEGIAERVAEILEQRHTRTSGQLGPYLTVAEAADYLRAKPQRVYDLLSAHRLARFKDGRRVLVSRAELDAHLAGTGSSRVACALPPSAQSRTRSRLSG